MIIFHCSIMAFEEATGEGLSKSEKILLKIIEKWILVMNGKE